MLTWLVFGVLIASVTGDENKDFYNFTVKDAQDQDFALEQFRGKVTLVVNVASYCGFTEKHYEALTKLDGILGHDGYFRVLAFPCNQFGEQEPGSMQEIVNFVVNTFHAEFPIFKKIDVVGENADKAFKNLYQQCGVMPDWNFYKYLVDHGGKVIGAWGPKVDVESLFDSISAAVKIAANHDQDGKVAKKTVFYHNVVDPGAFDYDADEEHEDSWKDEL